MNDVTQRDVLSPEELKDVLRVYHGAPNDGELLGPFERIMAHDAALRERVARLAKENEKTFSEYAGRTVMAEHALTVRTIERDEARRLAEYIRDRVPTASWIGRLPWEAGEGEETPSRG